MDKTQYTRKVDTNGRIMIPSELRDELDIRPADILQFYIHKVDGQTFLCIECPRVENEIDRAKRILREAGIEIN